MSNYVFKRVVIDSFMSYDHEEYDITNEGIVYLRGVNKEDSKSESNGSGKSALIADPIIWCLTGYTPRGAKEVSNRYLDRGAYVKLELSIDNTEYVVTRGTAKSEVGNIVSIIRNGEDLGLSKKEADKYLEDSVKLDWTQLTSVVILSQGLVGSLTSVKPTDRRYILEQLSGLETRYKDLVNTIDTVSSRINSKLDDLNKNKSFLEGQLSSLNTSREFSKRQLDDVLLKKQSYDEDKVTGRLNEITKRISEINDTLDKYNNDYSNIQSKITDIDNVLSAKNSIKSELTNNKYKLVNQKSSLEVDMNTKTKRLVELKEKYTKLSTGVCSTCGQKLTDDLTTNLLSSTNADIQSLGTNVIEITNQLKSLDPQISKYDNDIAKIDEEISEVHANKSELSRKSNEIFKSISVLNNEQKALKNEQSSLTVDLPDETVFINQISEYDNKISMINSKLSVVQTDIYSMDNDVKNISWIKNRSSRDLRAFMLNGVVSYLNIQCKEYSQYLFDDKVVEISIDNSKINILMGDRLVENLSGGERRRVDIILQLALRDLVLVDTGFSSNLLVIDEALDYLDSQGVSSVLDLISSQKSDSGTIILITHKSDADIIYDKEWVVMKNEQGVSSRLR